jgi:hypothetical protein
MAEVKLGGVWLHSLGQVSGIKWSTAWGSGPCGPDVASCTLAIDPSNDSTLVSLSKTFEVWDEGVKVFGGVLSEMGRDFPRSLSARSWGRRAGDFDAVDSSGNPTMKARTAVTQSIANGLPWTNPTVFDDDPIGTDDEPSMQRLDAFLSSWSVTVGKRWGVDPYGVAFVTTDPTTPTWYLDASDLDIGVADDGLFTRVRARYFSGVDADGNPTTPLTVTADDAVGQMVYGVIEYPMDLTGLGMISGSTALAYAQQQLTLLTVPQWLSRVTTNSARLLTPGGLGAYLPSVRAGQMVRLFNVPDSLGGLRNELALDVVLGEVEYDTESSAEVTIAPMGLAVRSLADVSLKVAQTVKAVGVPKTATPSVRPVWIGHGGVA